jgi:hypothetical protein
MKEHTYACVRQQAGKLSCQCAQLVGAAGNSVACSAGVVRADCCVASLAGHCSAGGVSGVSWPQRCFGGKLGLAPLTTLQLVGQQEPPGIWLCFHEQAACGSASGLAADAWQAGQGVCRTERNAGITACAGVASDKQQQHLPFPILVPALLACMWLLRLHSLLTLHASYNAQRVA